MLQTKDYPDMSLISICKWIIKFTPKKGVTDKTIIRVCDIMELSRSVTDIIIIQIQSVTTVTPVTKQLHLWQIRNVTGGDM